MQLQAQCFKRDTKIIQETHGEMFHIFPEGGKVNTTQIVLATEDRTFTTIVRESNFPNIDEFYSEIILRILDGYKPINGRIPKEIYQAYSKG